MFCDICGNTLRKIDSFLICKNGHTIQNAIEQAEIIDTFLRGSRRNVKKLKIDNSIKHYTLEPSVGFFIVLREVFHQAMHYFDIKSDIVYKIYTGMFDLLMRDKSIDSKINPLLEITDLDDKVFIQTTYVRKDSQTEEETDDDCKKNDNSLETKKDKINVLECMPASSQYPFFQDIETPINNSEKYPEELKSEKTKVLDFMPTPSSQYPLSQDIEKNINISEEKRRGRKKIDLSVLANTPYNKLITNVIDMKCTDSKRRNRIVIDTTMFHNLSTHNTKHLRQLKFIKNRFLPPKEEKTFFYKDAFKAKIEHYIPVDEKDIIVLIYIAKRSEMEKEGSPLFFNDFIPKIRSFYIDKRIKDALSSYKLHKHTWTFPPGPTSVCRHYLLTINTIFTKFTDPYSHLQIKFNNVSIHETGIITKQEDIFKQNLRIQLRTDYEIYLKYFEKICETVEIELEDKLRMIFKKYVLSYCFNRSFIPELEFCIFLTSYIATITHPRFYEIEKNILNYVGITRSHWMFLVNTNQENYKKCIAPDTFVRYILDLKAMRYFRFQKSKWLVKQYLEYKKSHPKSEDNSKTIENNSETSKEEKEPPVNINVAKQEII